MYRAETAAFEAVACVLPDAKVIDVCREDGELYAATEDGLYRSADGIERWQERAELADGISAVTVGPDGDTVYAGTIPPRIYRSDDGGHTWRRLEGFEAIPTADNWFLAPHPPHVRTLVVHPDAPDRLVAGIDGGGVYASEDRGATWELRTTGISQYVHHLLVLARDRWVAATDTGLFGTTTAGEWWTYLNAPEMKHRYFRESFRDDDAIYAGGARSHPGAWRRVDSAEAGLYEIRWTGGEPGMARVAYPGEPAELVNTGDHRRGETIAGTTGGRLLRREGGSWETAGQVPGAPQVRKLRLV